MIISHESPEYRMKWASTEVSNKFNGAYYYSKEIVENIIPNVRTNYNWVTININKSLPHSIVFIHNNLDSGERYKYLDNYPDQILVVGVPETASKVAHLGKTIYLPLSVDIANVAQYKCKKTKDVAYVGRIDKFDGCKVEGDYIGGYPREVLLTHLAKYKRVYAVGRVAIEAKILGCEVLPYDPRFPSTDIWEPLDNLEAAKILQRELDMLK